MTVFVANSNILELLGLKSSVDSTFINDAVVGVTIKDNNELAVAGQVWPLALAYVASSNGNYRCILPSVLSLDPDREHTAYIEVTAGAGRTGHWEYKFTPATRN